MRKGYHPFGSMVCSVIGHADDTEPDFHWDIAFYPYHLEDKYLRDGGQVYVRNDYCTRCGYSADYELVPMEDAPDSPLDDREDI